MVEGAKSICKGETSEIVLLVQWPLAIMHYKHY